MKQEATYKVELNQTELSFLLDCIHSELLNGGIEEREIQELEELADKLEKSLMWQKDEEND